MGGNIGNDLVLPTVIPVFAVTSHLLSHYHLHRSQRTLVLFSSNLLGVWQGPRFWFSPFLKAHFAPLL